jgi:pimeloyl-ACP methyl ester carboxylesterase
MNPLEEIGFRLTVNGEKLAVAARHRSVSEELIVFLHGYPCSKEIFHRVWSEPLLREYSILCPDFVGFGNSDKPADFPYSLEAHAAVLEEILRQVDGGPLHLVAHSMGAAVALLLPPERIDALASFANVEGNLLTDPNAARFPREPRLPRGKADLLILQRASGSASDIAIERTGASLAEWSRGGELLRRFQSARCRKAYFHGDDLGELRLKDELRDCNPVQIPDAGHFVMNDNPGEFFRELAKFMATGGSV